MDEWRAMMAAGLSAHVLTGARSAQPPTVKQTRAFLAWNGTCLALVMSRKLLAASLVAGAAILVVVFQSESEPVYSYRVGEFLARDLRAREVRVKGMLVRGSLCKVEPDCGYRFAIADSLYSEEGSPVSPPALAVSYDGCTIPDTFRDVPGYDIQIAAQGERCKTCHDFKATQLIAKCPGKYEMYTDGGYPPAPPIPLCDALKPRM
jgi:cytochrome c-type biogenesis protein CcmE